MSARYLFLLILLLGLQLASCSSGESKIYNLSGDGIVEKAEEIMNLSDPEYESRSKLAKMQSLKLVRLVIHESLQLRDAFNSYDDGKKYFNTSTGMMEKGNVMDLLDNAFNNDSKLKRCGNREIVAKRMFVYFFNNTNIGEELRQLYSNSEQTGVLDIKNNFEKPSQSKYHDDYEKTLNLLVGADNIWNFFKSGWEMANFNEYLWQYIRSYDNDTVGYTSNEPYALSDDDVKEIWDEMELFFRRNY